MRVTCLYGQDSSRLPGNGPSFDRICHPRTVPGDRAPMTGGPSKTSSLSSSPTVAGKTCRASRVHQRHLPVTYGLSVLVNAELATRALMRKALSRLEGGGLVALVLSWRCEARRYEGSILSTNPCHKASNQIHQSRVRPEISEKRQLLCRIGAGRTREIWTGAQLVGDRSGVRTTLPVA